MSIQPQPEPRNPVTHPDFKGIEEGNAAYHFTDEMNAACDALCDTQCDVTLPSLNSSELSSRKENQSNLQALLDSLEPELRPRETFRSLVIAVGAVTEVGLEGLRERGRIVPFVSVKQDTSPKTPIGPAELELGIYFPSLPAYVITGAKEHGSPLAHPPKASALVLAVRWMELIERVHAYSPEALRDSISLVYDGKSSPLLSTVTGSEVLNEFSTRRLKSFDAAHARCRELGAEVSKVDLYRGVVSGSVALSPVTEKVFEHFENGREDHRKIAARYSQVAALLSEKRFWLFYRYSIDAAHAKNPETKLAVENIQKGIRALRQIEIGVGSPLAKLIDGAHDSVIKLMQMQLSRIDQGPETILGKAMERVMEDFNSSLTALRKLDTWSQARRQDPRRAYLDALMLVSACERGYVKGTRQLRQILDQTLPEQDQESFNDELCAAYVSSLDVLRSIRSQINKAFPGLFVFQCEPARKVS